jgi:hypothetical protein
MSLQAPGFNPCTCNVISWSQAFAFHKFSSHRYAKEQDDRHRAAAAAAHPNTAVAGDNAKNSDDTKAKKKHAEDWVLQVGLYKLNSVYSSRLKPPGFNHRGYQVRNWFHKPLLSNTTCTATCRCCAWARGRRTCWTWRRVTCTTTAAPASGRRRTVGRRTWNPVDDV